MWQAMGLLEAGSSSSWILEGSGPVAEEGVVHAGRGDWSFGADSVGDGWSRCYRPGLRYLSSGYRKLCGDRKCLSEIGVVRAGSPIFMRKL